MDRKKEHDQEDGFSEEGDSNPLLQNNPFLTELNLILILMSSYSLSDDEENGLNLKNERVANSKQHQAKACISRLRTREMNECSRVRDGRRGSRFNTTIRDLRHGRKM